MDSSSPATRRQRSRIACGPCQERKRKCVGGNREQPCDLCRDYGYECSFRSKPRRSRREDLKASHPSRSPTDASNAGPLSQARQPQSFVTTSGSNSGPAFVRNFALAVDPSNAPPFQMLGWNVFIGERRRHVPNAPISVTEIVGERDMHDLVRVYFDKMDPCYGFLDRAHVEDRIQRRWQSTAVTMDDAILCGVAAIGCLFSTLQTIDTEALFVELLKSLLDLVVAEPATVDIATAWILRTVYLRLAAKPDEGWMASCITLHTIDSARLQCEPSPHDHFQRVEHECDPDIRRRMFGVAQHLNVWMSFDLARSRVRLQNVSPIPPAARPGDYTIELLELLSLSEKLDPSANLGGDALIAVLADVLGRKHTQSPSVLAQCNLMLCTFRRIHALKRRIPDDILFRTISLIENGIRQARTAIENGDPWHQVVNVPFQSICALLAIDTPAAFALLQPAIACLEDARLKYPTQTTKETVAVAHKLISLHQKRRQSEVHRQSEMLHLYPTSNTVTAPNVSDQQFEQAVLDLSWFDDFMVGLDENHGPQPE